MPQHRYIPILRWKQGERRGLAQLRPAAKVDVCPLFQIGPDQFRTPAGKNPHGLSAAQNLVNEIAAHWGTAPFFLDASALPATSSAPHPIVAIAAAARSAGLDLTPATSLGASASYQNAIAAVHAIDGKGAALRVDLAELTSAVTWLPLWKLSATETDLIADFRTSVRLVNTMGSTVASAFAAVHGAWRTVTVAGTSIPDDFSGYAAGCHLIPRAEWLLWNTLTAAGLPYRLDYGDHATVSLATPPPAIAWGYPINVKYTLKNDFLVCRGIKPRAVALSTWRPNCLDTLSRSGAIRIEPVLQVAGETT